MCILVCRAKGNLLPVGVAEYVLSIFCAYRVGQTHVFPVPACVPRVPINEPRHVPEIWFGYHQYLVSSTEVAETGSPTTKAA